MTFPERLQHRLEELELSQGELARRSGLSPGYISQLLSGQRGKRIGRLTAKRLKRALRVPDSFFDSRCTQMQKRKGESTGVVVSRDGAKA